MRICWIGLGNMGLPIATRLHNARFDVVGFDLAAKARAVAVDAGVPIADSVHEAAERADVVFTMLPRAERVRAALLDSAALTVTERGGLVVDCSTIAAADARDIAGQIVACPKYVTSRWDGAAGTDFGFRPN